MTEGLWISDRKVEKIGNHYIKWLKTQSGNYAKCYNRKLDLDHVNTQVVPFNSPREYGRGNH